MTFPSPSQNGFVLPMMLGFLALVGVWGNILVEQTTLEQSRIKSLLLQRKIFVIGQKHLSECEKQVSLSLPKISNFEQCCLIERSNQKPSSKSSEHFFRVSVHVMEQKQALNPLVTPTKPLAQVRLQSIVQLLANSQIQRISWREVLDHSFEKQISKEHGQVWEKISACNESVL